MVDVHLIKSEAAYEAALARAEELMDAVSGTIEAEELEHLAMLIDAYEEKNYTIDMPDPVSAIQFRMDQEGLTKKDLISYIGSSAKVSEVLSGRRDLTLSMIRALNRHLGIPAEVLIQENGGTIPEDIEGLDWSKFPVLEMSKKGLIKKADDIKGNAEKIVRQLIQQAGGFSVAAPLYRKDEGSRRNAKMDNYAMAAWCIHVLAAAEGDSAVAPYTQGVVDQAFLREVAKLSVFEDGPRQAQRYLAAHGVALVTAPHLANTYLDGVAMLSKKNAPVIGMTLRHDRLDNFWFCLLHELAHVGRHLGQPGECLFVDDLTLRATTGDDQQEKEADEWAEEALIPREIWNDHPAQDLPLPSNVISLAHRVGVHPSIVAGRIRWRDRNFHMLSQFVGIGEVRKHFDFD